MRKAAQEAPVDRKTAETGQPDRTGSASASPDAGMQARLLPSEEKTLRRAGHLFSLADLVWLPQAAVLAWGVAALLPVSVAGTSGLLAAVDPDWGWLLAGAFCFLILGLVRVRLTLKGQAMALHTAQTVKARLRARFLDSLCAISPAAPLPGSGEIAAQLGEQVDAIGPYLANFFPQKVRLTIAPLGILLATFCVAWLGGVILVVTGPVIPVFMALIGLKAKAASQAQQHELTRMSGILMDRLRGLETLRLFGAIDQTRDEIETVGHRFRIGTMKVLRIAFLSSTVLELFSALGIAFVAVIVGFSLLGQVETGVWSGSLSFAAGLYILLLAPEFYAPLRAYAAAYHERAAGLAAFETLAELETRFGQDGQSGKAAAQGAPSPARSIIHFAGAGISLEAEDLSLSLGGHPVFQSVSGRIDAGETVLLVGRSGAGKTTLIDLILGFHRPDSGKILAGGLDLESLDKGWWRQHIAWLSQSPVLFHGSLRSNLLAAYPTATDAELMAALSLAGCKDLISRLPRGLYTRIGENGFGLSVGEQRRVALARAALRRNPLLILADEPTAGLDRQTADQVIDGLIMLGRDKTLIIATHDPVLLKKGLRRIEIGANQRQESLSAGEEAAQ